MPCAVSKFDANCLSLTFCTAAGIPPKAKPTLPPFLKPSSSSVSSITCCEWLPVIASIIACLRPALVASSPSAKFLS